MFIDYITQQFSQLDIAQLVAIVVIVFWSYTRLETRLCGQMEKLDAKLDKLDEKVTDIDRRVCRMEGAFNNKECCVIKHSDQLKKAE